MRDSLSRLLRYQSDYRFLLDSLAEVYERGHLLTARGDLLKTDSLEKEYPRYPFPFKMVSSLLSFDLRKIFGCVIKPEDLKQLVDEQVLTRSVVYKKFPPNSFSDLLNDVYFQYTLFNEPEAFHFKLYDSVLQYRRGKNYWGYVLDEVDFDPALEGSCLLALYRYLLFRNVVQGATDISFRMMEAVEDCYPDSSGGFLRDAFAGFLEHHSFSMALDIVELCLKVLYRFAKPAEDLCRSLALELTPHLTELLGGGFADFVPDDPAVKMGQRAVKALCNLLCIDWARRYPILPGRSQTAMLELTQDVIRFEDVSFQKFEWDARRLRDYMFINYMYCHYPYKFLALLPLIMHEFVSREAKTEVVDGFDRFHMRQYLLKLSAEVDWDALGSSLRGLLTAGYMAAQVNADVGRFAVAGFLTEVLDRFVLGLYEGGRLASVAESLFLFLRRRGFVSTYFHWDREYLFYLYLKSAFRAALLNGRLFGEVLEGFQQCLENAAAQSDPQIFLTPDVLRSASYSVLHHQFQALRDFAEDIFTTALTKKLIFDNLSYFLVDTLKITVPGRQSALKRGEEVLVSWESTVGSPAKIKVFLRKNDFSHLLAETEGGSGSVRVVLPADLETGSWLLVVNCSEGMVKIEDKVVVMLI